MSSNTIYAQADTDIYYYITAIVELSLDLLSFSSTFFTVTSTLPQLDLQKQGAAGLCGVIAVKYS